MTGSAQKISGLGVGVGGGPKPVEIPIPDIDPTDEDAPLLMGGN